MVKLHEGRKNGTNENFYDFFENSDDFSEDDDDFPEDDDDFFDIF